MGRVGGGKGETQAASDGRTSHGMKRDLTGRTPVLCGSGPSSLMAVTGRVSRAQRVELCVPETCVT